MMRCLGELRWDLVLARSSGSTGLKTASQDISSESSGVLCSVGVLTMRVDDKEGRFGVQNPELSRSMDLGSFCRILRNDIQNLVSGSSVCNPGETLCHKALCQPGFILRREPL